MAGVLVATLVAAGLAVRSQRAGEEATAQAAAEEANRLAAHASSAGPLDLSLLLAAQAFRLARTDETRSALYRVLAAHRRVEAITRQSGYPAEAAIRSGRLGTIAFGPRSQVVSWSVGPPSSPRAGGGGPADWRNEWLVAGSGPSAEEVLAAGATDGVPWVRMVSADRGSSRLLVEGDRVGGRPVAGAVTGEGRILLLVSRPDDARPSGVTRWRLIGLDVDNGSVGDTGVVGTFPGPQVTLAADFADDGRSFVLWDLAAVVPTVLVGGADGGRVTLRSSTRHGISRGFRALPSGAVQLWDDGTMTLFDDRGTAVQELDRHASAVRDVAVSPDGTWAVSAGSGGVAFRWEVDPVTGRWSAPEPLSGHVGDILDVEVAPTGAELVTVAADLTTIRWDMAADGDQAGPSVTDDPEQWLRTVCAVVGRDLTPVEWERFLPGRSYAATCTGVR